MSFLRKKLQLRKKRGSKMYIKIYTKSQLILLRNLIPIIKRKYRLPREIFSSIEKVLESRKLGRTGFIAILLKPIESDTIEIGDILNCYPHQLKIKDNIECIQLKEKNTYMTKNKEWYMDIWEIKRESSYIYVIYSMTMEDIYGCKKEGE